MSNVLEIFTLYYNTSDYPGEYVIRRFRIFASNPEPVADKDLWYHSEDLEACRDEMAKRGLYRMKAQPEDDPVIIESYI